MTDNNQWIGDSHKALEERKEPRVEPPASAPQQPAPSSEPAKGLADWVKRMGGTLVGDPGGVTTYPYLSNGPASILRAQTTAADWPWRIIRNVK